MIKIKDYTFGVFVAFCLMALHQDLLGLEGYVAHVRAHWVELPWGVWIVLLVFGFGFMFFTRDKERG